MPFGRYLARSTCRGVPVRMSPPFQALPFSLVMRCACVMYLQRAPSSTQGYPVRCACSQPASIHSTPLHSAELRLRQRAADRPIRVNHAPCHGRTRE